MNNYMMYMGTDSIYTHTVAYARDETCTVCGSGTPLPVSLSMTLQQVRPTGPSSGQFLCESDSYDHGASSYTGQCAAWLCKLL